VPFTGSDGNVYTGKKEAQVLAVDANTGKVLGGYDQEDMDINPDLGSWAQTPAVVMIGRTKYTVTIREYGTQHVRLNVTLAEYSNPALREASETPERWEIFDPGMSMVAIDDVLVYGSEARGWQWSRALGSRLVGLYVADSTGSLRQVPLDRLHPAPGTVEGEGVRRSLLIPQDESLMQVCVC
jgi:hypothetical protein